ncbi:MAG TPA: beta-ketoacyl-[acyl-carrier-protein] synthase family protein [Gemmatimonadaceae bacterium]|nr:beta-ketoacyl-[acyl-carrier-protein] synthase family protein [Gemmatimonadaceae bacterium]
MTTRRVAVTGVGVLSAIGNDPAAFWESLAAGRPGIGPVTQADCSLLRFQNGAEVRDFDPTAHFEPRAADTLDRFAQLAVVAARQAVDAAGLAAGGDWRARAAVVTGSCLGGQTTMDRGFVDIYVDGRTRPHPLTIPRTMANAGASAVTMQLGITGPAFTTSTACSSATHAIGLAYWMVRNGMAEVALAGGSESPFSPGLLRAWDAVRVVSPDTCRPFDRNRKGMILGEGAAMLVLEPLDAALARGATVLGEVVGFGMSSDAHHLTQPSGDGAAQAMRAALDDAGIRPEQVGYVNAHGTGTTANDPTECRALRAVFGGHAERGLAVSSTKSMHGHALGAAGAIEAAATLLALHHGVLPPTANFGEADPECALDVIPNEARRAEVECALSNSFAFGGLNAVLALRRAGR